MFEFVLSCGDGTMLDYGMADANLMARLSASGGGCLYFEDDGDCSRIGFKGSIISNPEYFLRFRADSPDCVTGQ